LNQRAQVGRDANIKAKITATKQEKMAVRWYLDCTNEISNQKV